MGSHQNRFGLWILKDVLVLLVGYSVCGKEYYLFLEGEDFWFINFILFCFLLVLD